MKRRLSLVAGCGISAIFVFSVWCERTSFGHDETEGGTKPAHPHFHISQDGHSTADN